MPFKTALTDTALVLSYKALSNHYFILRLQHQALATAASPGHYITLILPQRLPITACIMSSSTPDNTIEVLLFAKKETDKNLLANTSDIQWQGLEGTLYQGDELEQNEKVIVIAENIFIAAAVFFCRRWRALKLKPALLVLLGLDSKCPFPMKPSELLINDMPLGVIASLPLLDDWNIPSRIASTLHEAGCYAGTVQALLNDYQAQARLKNPKIIVFN